MNWTKTAVPKAPGKKKTADEQWICRVPPNGRFTMTVTPTGDGRFSWAVYARENANPAATGMARNLGGAQATAEQYVKRSADV